MKYKYSKRGIVLTISVLLVGALGTTGYVVADKVSKMEKRTVQLEETIRTQGDDLWNLEQVIKTQTEELVEMELKYKELGKEKEAIQTELDTLQEENSKLKENNKKLEKDLVAKVKRKEAEKLALAQEKEQAKKSVTVATATSAKSENKEQASASKKQATEGEVSAKGSGKIIGNFTATHYTAFCDTGCIGVTATGINVKSTIYYKGMRVIAVDPSVIPLGSIVKVHTANGSFTAIAGDTGGAIKGNKIDILVSSKGEARSLGVINVTIELVK